MNWWEEECHRLYLMSLWDGTFPGPEWRMSWKDSRIFDYYNHKRMSKPEIERCLAIAKRNVARSTQ